MTSPSPPQDTPPAAAIVVAAALLLVGTGAYGTYFWLSHDGGPPPEAFAPAAAIVRAQFQKDDLIYLAPFYATRAREHLGDLHPLAVRTPAAADLEIRRRVWVFALFGAEEAIGGVLESAGFQPAFSHYGDGIAILRYERPARARQTFDFVAEIRRARVFHELQGVRTPCARWAPRNQQGGPPGRWVCPQNGDWFYVAPEWHRMGEHLRWCLWAHPPNEGRLVIEYDDVPLAGVIAGRAGHTLNSSVHARAPVFLDVVVGAAPAQRFEFALDEYFRPFRLHIPRSSTASTAGRPSSTVQFRVSSPDAGINHFCFVADVRRPVAKGTP